MKGLLILAVVGTVAALMVTGTHRSHDVAPSATAPAMMWPAPDDRLTPGATVPGCSYPRPASDRNVSTATKHRAALAYHYTGRAGIAYVEYDHRIPYALCGADTLPNIWPEPVEAGFTQSEFAFNHKDELETLSASRVRYHHMTLKAAQLVFAGDWRAGWCTYVHRPSGLC